MASNNSINISDGYCFQNYGQNWIGNTMYDNTIIDYGKYYNYPTYTPANDSTSSIPFINYYYIQTIDTNVQIFSCFQTLSKDIIKHIKENPDCEIIVADELTKLYYGWADIKTEKVWKIKIKDFRASVDDNTIWTLEEKGAMKQAMKTAEGRVAMINSLIFRAAK